MTLNEAIYDVRSIIRRNNLSDDDRLDDRLLKHWIHNQRALWIRNETNKNHTIDDQVAQTIGCMELEMADRSACPSFTTGYSVLQTVEDIPKIIELNRTDGIIEVAPIDKIARPFSYVNIQRARYGGNGRFNSNIIFAFRYHQKILLISKNMEADSFAAYIRYLRVKAIFENPEDVAIFSHVNGDPCYSDDMEYPMNNWMWNYIRDQVIKTNFNLLVTAPSDKVNDGDDSLKQDGNVS
jgi:hypothetical protein